MFILLYLQKIISDCVTCTEVMVIKNCQSIAVVIDHFYKFTFNLLTNLCKTWVLKLFWYMGRFFVFMKYKVNSVYSFN